MKQLSLFILFPVFLTTLGEFFLKFNLNSVVIPFSYDGIKIIFSNPLILVGILMIVLGSILWIVAMSKYEMSFLYPFLSINYVVIIIGSQFFLNEEVSIWRYISIVFIIIGLIVISRSPYAKSDH